MSDPKDNWVLISHLDHGENATLCSITPDTSTNGFTVTNLSSQDTSGKEHAPWFLGVDKNQKIILFSPDTKEIILADKMPADAFGAYAYKEPGTSRMWFVHDGDKETGNDPLNCGNKGSSVTIFDQSGDMPRHIATLCVGRGHHVPTFITPSDKYPDLKKLAFVSNLLDGSIHVVDNDDSNPDSYLSIIHTINLCEADKEKEGITGIPNNAFPHGKQYSLVTGKIYSLNNGYGTVAVIDPKTYEIEDRIKLKGASNLLLSPDGKYLIGKGADRKSDNDHVIGNIGVIDTQAGAVVKQYDIVDFYPSTYRFSPDGSQLFVTSAATGKGTQKENLKIDTLYIYDASKLPELSLMKVLNIGNADCSRRPIAFPTNAEAKLAFLPNPSDGSVTIVNRERLEVIDTVKIADQACKEFSFSFWGNDIYGA